MDKRKAISREWFIPAKSRLRSLAGSKQSVAVHWKTFILSDEPLDEPPKRLKEALAKAGIPQREFLVLKHGQTIILDAGLVAGKPE